MQARRLPNYRLILQAKSYLLYRSVKRTFKCEIKHKTDRSKQGASRKSGGPMSHPGPTLEPPLSMARRARDSVAPLRRSSTGWMPARIGRSAGVGRRHPVTICKASLMAGSIRQVWALRHQAGVQYSAVECTRARVTIRRVIAPAPQPDPGSCLRSATRDVNFLRSDSRCRRYVSDLSKIRSGVWARSRMAGFRCCIRLSAHV